MVSAKIYDRCAPLKTHCWTDAHLVFLARRRCVMAKATEVFGCTDIAKHWLTRPAIGLAHLSPCSLLSNNQGYAEVFDYLYRLEYCVYT